MLLRASDYFLLDFRILLALGYIWLMLIYENEAFKCFSCSAESTEECQAKGIVEACDKGTNTCFTQIRYYGGTFKVKKIVKNCILRPSCEEEMAKSGNKDCQQKENNFDCVNCCNKELCNKDSGTVRLASNHIITLGMVFFTILFHSYAVR